MWRSFTLFTYCVPALVFSAPAVSDYDIDDLFADGLHDMDVGKIFGEWDQTRGTFSPRLTNEWHDEETDQWLTSISTAEQLSKRIDKDSAAGQPEENRAAVSVENARKGGSGAVLFTRPKSPRDFVERWPEQKRLFEGLQRPLSLEQRRVLGPTHYAFAAAGQLLEELGEAEFLKRFGEYSITQMQKDTGAEIKQRKTAKKNREVAEAIDDVGGKGPSDMVFVKPKSPKDFAKRWLKQKRLYESLPRPLTPKQTRVLMRTYYQFAAAGQLLEELGKRMFLEKFGNGTVNQMRTAAEAEIRWRRAVEREQEAAEGAGSKDEGNTLDDIAFTRPKSPKGFVKRWPEQKRLFESLPRPLAPEHKQIVKKTYYQFATAGRLLEELGEKAFLQKFGKSSIEQMQKAVKAEMKQRKTREKERSCTAS